MYIYIYIYIYIFIHTYHFILISIHDIIVYALSHSLSYHSLEAGEDHAPPDGVVEHRGGRRGPRRGAETAYSPPLITIIIIIIIIPPNKQKIAFWQKQTATTVNLDGGSTSPLDKGHSLRGVIIDRGGDYSVMCMVTARGASHRLQQGSRSWFPLPLSDLRRPTARARGHARVAINN